jgi:hypothetical protein
MPKYFTIIHSITALVNINTVGNACTVIVNTKMVSVLLSALCLDLLKVLCIQLPMVMAKSSQVMNKSINPSIVKPKHFLGLEFNLFTAILTSLQATFTKDIVFGKYWTN